MGLEGFWSPSTARARTVAAGLIAGEGQEPGASGAQPGDGPVLKHDLDQGFRPAGTKNINVGVDPRQIFTLEAAGIATFFERGADHRSSVFHLMKAGGTNCTSTKVHT
jgi:hypothetical protein